MKQTGQTTAPHMMRDVGALFPGESNALMLPPRFVCTALISGGADTADAKLAIMEECGFKVTRNPSEMGKLLKALL